MVTPVKFTREIDQRVIHILGTPGENRGVRRNELELTYTVRASLGAVQMRVVVQLDVQVAMNRGYKVIDPRSVSSHFKRKLNDWWIDSAECDVLEQGHCFGDTGYSVADRVWSSFMEDTELGWKHLEEIYLDWRKP